MGRRLVEECARFAWEAGYSKITLSTQSMLTSAHGISQAVGFHLVSEEPHHRFGKDIAGPTWETDLT